MKTAVTIPDPLFKAADKLAKRLGVSRSELYARAIEQYTKAEERNGDWSDPAEITRQVNAALRAAGKEANGLDAAWKAARNRALAKEDW